MSEQRGPEPMNEQRAPGSTESPVLDASAADATAVSAVARRMWENDVPARSLGIEPLAVSPGRARLRMRVRPEFVNAVGVCHGGYIFLLADTAFAFACNSHNQKAVAAAASIDFVAPAHEGDELLAEGTEQHLAGRTGVYDVRVTRQDGTLVALFRGKSATIRGRHLEDPGAG
jgi:acyl-CoA thioesterase